MISRRYWLFAAMSLLFGCWALPCESAEIHLKPIVTIRSALVTLGDIAEVRSPDQVEPDQDELETLKRLKLFPAPNVGKSKLVRDREIRELLNLNDLSRSHHVLRGSRFVRVIRGKPIAEKVVRASSEKGEPKEKPAPPAVLALVASRDIARGEILRSVDLTVGPVADAYGQTTHLTRDPIDLVGREATRPVRFGQPVDSRYLRRPILVKRGDIVAVVARAAGVRVQKEARAMSQGAVGDLVLLQGLDNRAKFSARVTGRQEAEVYASGVVVSDEPARGTETLLR